MTGENDVSYDVITYYRVSWGCGGTGNPSLAEPLMGEALLGTEIIKFNINCDLRHLNFQKRSTYNIGCKPVYIIFNKL